MTPISVGGIAFGSKIVEAVNCEQRMFCPADPLTLAVHDIKPRHKLVVWTRGPSNEKVRLEANIDHVLDGKGAVYQVGTTNYFQDDASRVRLKAGVFGFERFAFTYFCF